MRCILSLFALATLLAGTTAAAQPVMTLAGNAQIGRDIRAVRFNFTCVPSAKNATGTLGIALEVPNYATLRGFPFDLFEGPDADAGQLTRLEATGAGATVQGMFTVSGSAGIGADRPFVLAAAAPRQGDPIALRAVGNLLHQLAGPARLVWRQGAPAGKGTGFTATLDLAPGDSARLQTLVAPCMKNVDLAAIAPIRFAAGKSAATIDGGVIRGDRDTYAVTANAGQTMTVRIKALENNAVFQIYAPGGVLFHNDDGQGVEGTTLKGAGDGEDATQWQGKLPATGRYLIVVGGSRGNAQYRLTVEIR